MLVIRSAQHSDAAHAAEILRRSIIELCADDHRNDPKLVDAWTKDKTPEQVAVWIDAPQTELLIADIGGAPAGVGAVAARGEILLNYVSPDYVGKGVSRALLAEMERRLCTNATEEGVLASTATALAFYERHGWRRAECSSCALGPGIDGLPCNPMQKRLRG